MEKQAPTEFNDDGLIWRVSGGAWFKDYYASQMVLHVIKHLLDIDPSNAVKLSGKSKKKLHLASRYPLGSKSKMFAIPDHSNYVTYPYDRNWNESAQRCREMGKCCGVNVEVLLDENPVHLRFWKFAIRNNYSIPGLIEGRSPYKLTPSLNSVGDKIKIEIYFEGLSLRVLSPPVRARQISKAIIRRMGDQDVYANIEECAENGSSIAVCKPWTYDDEDEWPEAAEWMEKQFKRLCEILNDYMIERK